MPNNKGQSVEANVREGERENERSEESKESEEMREMRDEIEVLKRALEEQKLRAQRDALAAEVERGAGGGRIIVDSYAYIWAGSPIRHVATFFVSP